MSDVERVGKEVLGTSSSIESLEEVPTHQRGKSKVRGYRRKPGGGRPPKEPRPPAEEPEPPVTEAEILALGTLGGLLWGFAALRFPVRPLNPDEQRQLGTAAAPVVRKYLPMIGGFEAEFGLLIVVAGLIQATYTPRPTVEEVNEELRGGSPDDL